MLTNDIVSFEQLGPNVQTNQELRCSQIPQNTISRGTPRTVFFLNVSVSSRI